uniref:Uncharacterized protein n=1 Tax=Arcella intermedia TaxID=1963864 RepID=A0A6B2L082_9EUKA
MGLAYNTYMDSTRARDCFVNAKNLSGLEVTLSGAMGRRTKFQTFDLPQLVLLAKSKESVANEGTSANVPENVESPDPDAPRLDHTKFSEKVVDSDSNLLVIDQCIILALCLDVKNRNPRHGLTWEEMRVYVERILKNPNNWLVHSMALLLRARLEFEDHKYMDKASLQIQVLVDQYNSALESEYKVATRMKYVDLIEYPPQVLLKKELAQKWLAIGSAASAQKLFEQLEMWEEIAECFIIREMVSEAEQFLRKRIDIHPTPRLWCTLGDVTGNPLYYQKSWELSKGRFTRAKRNLGKIAMHKQNFQEAIEHYEEALKVNTQFADAWFRLGCCALAVSNLELAQKSFARVVQLHPDDGESWSNLASTHIKRGKMKEAFASLKEAIKYKTENWRIWENLLFVCLDLGEFSEALVVLDKLVELKDKEVDVKALSLLVTFVVNEIKTGKAPPGNFMHRNLHQLLEKIVTKIGDNAELWNVYSNYWMGLGNTEEAVKQRHKQCRALQVEGWFDTAPLFKKVVDACQQLTNDQITHNKPKQLYSTRLYLQSVIKKSKDSFEGTPDHDRLKAMVDLITKQEATHN